MEQQKQLPSISNKSQSLTPSKKNSPIKRRNIFTKQINLTNSNSRHITPNKPNQGKFRPMLEISNYNVLTEPGNLSDNIAECEINTCNNATTAGRRLCAKPESDGKGETISGALQKPPHLKASGQFDVVDIKSFQVIKNKIKP